MGQVLEFKELDTQGFLDENDVSRPVGASKISCPNVQRIVVAGLHALGGWEWVGASGVRECVVRGGWRECVLWWRVVYVRVFPLEVHRSTPHQFPWNATDPNTTRICLRTNIQVGLWMCFVEFEATV